MNSKEELKGFEEIRKEKKMSPSEFYAIPRDPPSDSKLPIYDAAHVRNALARFNQIEGVSSEEKAKAKRKIKTAAKKFGIEVSEDFSNLKDLKGGFDLSNSKMEETEEQKEQPQEESKEETKGESKEEAQPKKEEAESKEEPKEESKEDSEELSSKMDLVLKQMKELTDSIKKLSESQESEEKSEDNSEEKSEEESEDKSEELSKKKEKKALSNTEIKSQKMIDKGYSKGDQEFARLLESKTR